MARNKRLAINALFIVDDMARGVETKILAGDVPYMEDEMLGGAGGVSEINERLDIAIKDLFERLKNMGTNKGGNQ